MAPLLDLATKLWTTTIFKLRLAQLVTDGAADGDVPTYQDGVVAWRPPQGGGVTLEQVQDAVANLVKPGSNVDVTYDDDAGTLTISSTGGGSGIEPFPYTGLYPAVLFTPTTTTGELDVRWSESDQGANAGSFVLFGFQPGQENTVSGYAMVVANEDHIPPGAFAVVADGQSPPRMAYRDANGTVSTLGGGLSVTVGADGYAHFEEGGGGSGGSGGGTPSRATATYTTGLLNDGATEVGEVPLGKGYRLYNLTATSAAWVRVYLDAQARSDDANRSVNTDPGPNDGVVAEMIGTNARYASSTAGWDAKGTPDGHIPISVTNRSGAPAAITLTFLYISQEA